MKKCISVLIVAVMLLCVCACFPHKEPEDVILYDDDFEETDYSVPADFNNAFLYSTADGTFLYKPETKETVKIGPETFASECILFENGEKAVALFDNSLYMRTVGSQDKGTLLSTQSFGGFQIDLDEIVLYYIANEELYKKDMISDETVLVAKDIYEFIASPDGNNVVYSTKDSKLYYYNGESTLISDGAYGTTISISKEVDRVIYLENRQVKLFTAGAGSTILADGIDYCLAEDLNCIYFVGYDKRYSQTVYFYNGTETVKISDEAAHLTPCGRYLVYTEEVQTQDDYYNQICFANGDKVTKTDVARVEKFAVSPSGKTVYYSDSGNLYKVSVGETFGEPEFINSGIASYNINFYGEEAVYVVADNPFGSDTGELYVGTKKISDYATYIYGNYSSLGFFYKETDGTLFCYRDGQSKLVCKPGERECTESYDFFDGAVVFLVSSTIGDGNSALYYWNGQETVLIAENVNCFEVCQFPIHKYEGLQSQSRYVYVPEPYADSDGDAEPEWSN